MIDIVFYILMVPCLTVEEP